jgi:hypothetical protein
MGCANAIAKAGSETNPSLAAYDKVCPEKPTCCPGKDMAASCTDPCSDANLSLGHAIWYYQMASGPVTDLRGMPPYGSPTRCAMSGFPTSVTVVNYALALFDQTHRMITSINPASPADNAARYWSRCLAGIQTDDAGHVIANSLGGPGLGPMTPLQSDFNIFPQDLTSNRVRQRTREVRVASAAKSNRVCIKVALAYSSAVNPARPSQITYDVWVNGVRNPNSPIDFTSYGPVIPNP